MTSKNLNLRIKKAVFLSVLLSASMQMPLIAHASTASLDASVDAIDTITYFSQELPIVDAAPVTLVNAAPITKPTAKSIKLPFMANSLNSFNIPILSFFS